MEEVCANEKKTTLKNGFTANIKAGKKQNGTTAYY